MLVAAIENRVLTLDANAIVIVWQQQQQSLTQNFISAPSFASSR